MTTSKPIPLHREVIDFIEGLVSDHCENHKGHAGGESLPRLRFAHEFWTYFHERHSKDQFSPAGFESFERLTFRPYRDLMNNVCHRKRDQLTDLFHQSDLLSDEGEDLQGQLKFLRIFQDAVNSNPEEVRHD